MYFTTLYVSYPSLAKQEREIAYLRERRNFKFIIQVSHTMLKGKFGTVSDNEDIEPVVNYIEETKINFKCDGFRSAVVRHRELHQDCKSYLDQVVTPLRVSRHQLRH